jgi:hypothetical protein
MNIPENISKGIGNIFADGNDEFLIFIFIFLVLFRKSASDYYTDRSEEQDGSLTLFFAVTALVLLLTGDRSIEQCS